MVNAKNRPFFRLGMGEPSKNINPYHYGIQTRFFSHCEKCSNISWWCFSAVLDLFLGLLVYSYFASGGKGKKARKSPYKKHKCERFSFAKKILFGEGKIFVNTIKLKIFIIK